MAISDSKWRTKKIGTVVPFEKPELTEVVVKVQNPVPLNQPPKSFDTVSMGTPLVRRVTPQGEVLFHPLPNLQDYIASGGLCRIGASYYEGPHGYSIVLRDGKFHEFTNFKGRVSAKEIEISASGERVERYLIELTAEDGKIYQVRIPVEEWPSLLDVIERYAPLCQVYGDEIGNHRERFKRLSGFWLKKIFPSKTSLDFGGGGLRMQISPGFFSMVGARIARLTRYCHLFFHPPKRFRSFEQHLRISSRLGLSRSQFH